MPSIITPAISSPCFAKQSVKASTSLKGKKIILSVSFTGAIILGLSVAATAKEVLP